MPPVTLTQHQNDALAWLITKLVDEEVPVIALRGYAGTGKTTLIPALRDALLDRGRPVAVGAPTHRAAMILRRKGIASAETVHSLALTPYFQADYARAIQWVDAEEIVPCCWPNEEDALPPHDDIDGLPWLIYERVKPDLARANTLHRNRRYSAKRRLESIGISGRDFFDRFGSKTCEGVLIIDEASMVGASMLKLCQQAYPQVCLVGDPGQLPPVRDTAVLATVDGIDLTEVHRQAADSPILQLATKARQGEPVWRYTQMRRGDLSTADVLDCRSAPSAAFLDAPLLVWRNVTRVTCTHAIREALGYDRALVVGEPLVCKSTSKEDRALGFYNNALYKIVEIDPDDPRHVTVEDALERSAEIYVHLEELDGDEIDPKAISFRFGYCLTTHTAQGGEWPTVYVDMLDLQAFGASTLNRPERAAEFAQWSYTAITRAKSMLIFLTQRQFDAATRQERSLMANPFLTSMSTTISDDIADPVTPPAVLQAPSSPPPVYNAHEALLQGFCSALQAKMFAWMAEHHKAAMDITEHTWTAMVQHVDKLNQGNEHAAYQLANALAAIQERGLTVSASPYTATVQAVSPDGYAVSITVQKPEADALVEELGRLTPWLKNQHYTAPSAVVAI